MAEPRQRSTTSRADPTAQFGKAFLVGVLLLMAGYGVPSYLRHGVGQVGSFVVIPEPFATVLNATLGLAVVLAATVVVGVRRNLRGPARYCVVAVGFALGAVVLAFSPRFIFTKSVDQPLDDLNRAMLGLAPFIATVGLSGALLGRSGAR